MNKKQLPSFRAAKKIGRGPQPLNAPHPHGGPLAQYPPTAPLPPVSVPKPTASVPTPTPPTTATKPPPLEPAGGGNPLPKRPTPVVNVYSDNTNGADMVFIFGLGLIIVNEIHSGRLMRTFHLMWNGSQDPGGDIKKDLAILGGEMLFIVILTIIAQTNRDVKNFMLVFIIGLWIVWSVINAKTLTGWTATILKPTSVGSTATPTTPTVVKTQATK